MKTILIDLLIVLCGAVLALVLGLAALALVKP